MKYKLQTYGRDVKPIDKDREVKDIERYETERAAMAGHRRFVEEYTLAKEKAHGVD